MQYIGQKLKIQTPVINGSQKLLSQLFFLYPSPSSSKMCNDGKSSDLPSTHCVSQAAQLRLPEFSYLILTTAFKGGTAAFTTVQISKMDRQLVPCYTPKKDRKSQGSMSNLNFHSLLPYRSDLLFNTPSGCDRPR
jgi:hypothetical protein